MSSRIATSPSLDSLKEAVTHGQIDREHVISQRPGGPRTPCSCYRVQMHACLNECCSRLNRWLEEGYQRKKKRLVEKYLRDIDGCKAEYLKFQWKI